MEEEEDALSNLPNYGSIEYWEDRYKTNCEPFDWYQTWENLAPVFSPLFTGLEHVLNIGCGNSPMSYDMSKTTFSRVTSIDFSPTVISHMKRKYAGCKNLAWYTMDCSKMSFLDETFDVIFDKGTIDSILCGNDSMDMLTLTLIEVQRVLKSGGIFVMISFGSPSTRVKMLRKQKLPWHLHKTMFLPDTDKEGSFHYVYIFQKLSAAASIEMLESDSEYYEEEEEEEEEEEAPEPV